jgi:hypothetical protein
MISGREIVARRPSRATVARRPFTRERARALTRALARTSCSFAVVIALSAASAHAATEVSVFPLVQPYRLGAHAKATISLRLFGGANGVPAPLRGLVLQLPAGLGVDLSGVATCPTAALRARGAAGCPGGSLIGHGRATLEVHAGSQTLPESAAISVFRAPDRGGHRAFAIYGHGQTPLDETTISTAILLSDSPPYGSKLVVTVPPIPTLTFEPDASYITLSLTIGGSRRAPNPIVIPSHCPRGGFAFAASFSFAGGGHAGESGRLPCP